MTTTRVPALAIGALAVASFDMLDCIVVYGLLRGVTATQCFQGVASGLLGRSSFQGGWATVLLGGALHLLNATVIVCVYSFASRRISIFTARPVLSAVLYGCLVFIIMNFVVVPLSAARVMRITLVNLVNGFVGHVISVGLPCLWVVRTTAPRETAAA